MKVLRHARFIKIFLKKINFFFKDEIFTAKLRSVMSGAQTKLSPQQMADSPQTFVTFLFPGRMTFLAVTIECLLRQLVKAKLGGFLLLWGVPECQLLVRGEKYW